MIYIHDDGEESVPEGFESLQTGELCYVISSLKTYDTILPSQFVTKIHTHYPAIAVFRNTSTFAYLYNTHIIHTHYSSLPNRRGAWYCRCGWNLMSVVGGIFVQALLALRNDTLKTQKMNDKV